MLHTPNSELRPPLKRRPLWRDLGEIALLVVIIYTFVNLTTARAVVEGSSMRPNFETGQLVIVNRFAYFFSSPQRGDVIVLHNPRNGKEDFIKRVIGLPGEYVQIIEGRVYINGVLLEEPYIERFCTSCNGTWQVGPDEYFVLGDNRPSSHDSHAFGPIKRSLIVGQAWIRYWPVPDVAIIAHPSYAPIPSDFTPPPPTPTRTPAPYTPSPIDEREFDSFSGI
ncbi:MAG: signal peptidase I [Aggregatilineales bacterium]